MRSFPLEVRRPRDGVAAGSQPRARWDVSAAAGDSARAVFFINNVMGRRPRRPSSSASLAHLGDLLSAEPAWDGRTGGTPRWPAARLSGPDTATWTQASAEGAAQGARAPGDRAPDSEVRGGRSSLRGRRGLQLTLRRSGGGRWGPTPAASQLFTAAGGLTHTLIPHTCSGAVGRGWPEEPLSDTRRPPHPWCTAGTPKTLQRCRHEGRWEPRLGQGPSVAQTLLPLGLGGRATGSVMHPNPLRP